MCSDTTRFPPFCVILPEVAPERHTKEQSRISTFSLTLPSSASVFPWLLSHLLSYQSITLPHTYSRPYFRTRTPLHQLPEDDDGIYPTSGTSISIRPHLIISRGFRWRFDRLSMVGPPCRPDMGVTRPLAYRARLVTYGRLFGPTNRRALLVDVSYSGDHNKWPALDGPPDDVNRLRQLLTGM